MRYRLLWQYDQVRQEFALPSGRIISLHELAGMLHDRASCRFDFEGAWAGWRMRGPVLLPPGGSLRGPRISPHNASAIGRWLLGTTHSNETDAPAAGTTMTPLDKPLKRELQIGDVAYTLVLDPQGLKLTEKGHRRGVELLWKDLVSGDAALATALRASLEAD